MNQDQKRKRRKSRRRSKSSSETFVAARETSSSLANFVALVAGMVTTLFLCMMIWSYFTDRNRSTQELVETDLSSSRQLDEEAIAFADPEQLEVVLMKYNEWDRNAEIPVLLSQNEDRVKIANQMLQLPLSTSQRNLAINSKIEALASIYGLDFLHNLKTPDIGATLIATAKSHLSDPNSKIVQTSKLAIVKVDTFELIKSRKLQDLDSILYQMTEVLMEYPDDQLVISTIEILVTTLARFERTVGLRTMSHLTSNINIPDATETMKFVGTLSDKMMLVETNYDRQFSNRWVNGAAGQQSLLATSIQLATDKSGGQIIVKEVGNVAYWFEQANQYQEAKAIYQALVDSANDRLDSAATATALRLGENGISRCNLINQKLTIQGTSTNGEAINPDDYKDRVLILIFWSANAPSSLAAMRDFHKSSRSLVTSNKIKVLAICMDKNLDRSVEEILKTIPNFSTVFINTGSQNSILQQCPITNVPHALAINHFGEVDDVNVPLDELQTAAEYLATKRFDSR